MPQLKTVNSSKVFQLGYDPEDSALYVRFVPNKHHPAGRIAVYRGVSQEVADQVEGAPSVGQALGQFVEGVYPFSYL